MVEGKKPNLVFLVETKLRSSKWRWLEGNYALNGVLLSMLWGGKGGWLYYGSRRSWWRFLTSLNTSVPGFKGRG